MINHPTKTAMRCGLFAVLACSVFTLAAQADSDEAQRLKVLVNQPADILIDDGAARYTFDVPAGTRKDLTEDGAAAEPGLKSVLRVDVDRVHPKSYAVQMFSSRTNRAVAKGDALFASCWLRLADDADDASGIAALRLQLIREPWSSPVYTDVILDRTWKRIFISGVADRDYAVGDLQLVVQVGHQRQVVDVGACVLLNLGAKADVTSLPHNKLTWSGRAADAPWRAEAQRRIERYRMGDLAIRVTDSNGKPVAGATVTVKQKTRSFGIGSFATPETLLANSRDGEKTRDVFQRLFNRATTPIYWADWGWPRQREQYLATAKWLTDHGMITRGHVMIYPGFQFMPKAVVALKDKPIELRERLLQQVREISDATRPLRFREYDVTNELRDCVDLHQLLGRDVVAEWFAEARKQVPDARLAINENSILTSGGATEANEDLYLDWYRFLKSKGHAPDVIGFQSHFSEAVTSPERVWTILDRFAKETDAELQITEFDLNTLDEAGQADYTRDFLTACFAHPRVTGFTMWGFWEGDHWIPRAGLWRRDWSPKPSAKALEELLTKMWWTNATVTTAADGTATVKAFLGEHTVTASSGLVSSSATAVVTAPAATASATIPLPGQP